MEKRVTFRISAKLLKAAQEKAMSESIPLSLIFRWLLERWTRGEIATVPPGGKEAEDKGE